MDPDNASPSPEMRAAYDVVVVGSANLDVVRRVEVIPAPGETVLALGRAEHPGGKGLNQAVAAARAGARTTLVATLGDDRPGELLRAVVRDEGIGTGALGRGVEPTGVATIVVATSGENTIVVDPGANALTRPRPDLLDAATSTAVLVLQLEVDLDCVRESVALAHEAGVLVLVNAAPAAELDDDLLAGVDVLVVNEHEAALLAGTPVGSDDDLVGARLRALRSRLRPAATVVVTLGAAGARALGPDGELDQPGVPAEVVDTTGAGDTFVGYLAAALAQGRDWPRALAEAVTAGALAVETAGAVPGVPTAEAVRQRLSNAR